MRNFLVLFILLPTFLWGQDSQFVQHLIEVYPTIKERASETRTTKHSDITPLLDQIAKEGKFHVKLIGYSVEGRKIKYIKLGNGPIKVLAWSQMHGNEPTATMSLFDLMNWFRKDTIDTLLKKKLLSKLTIFLVPMLNPDGAEYYNRRNALGIDLNRDAQSLTSPESQLLYHLRDSIKAHFAFDLHDQNPYYGNPVTKKPATLSFLAAFPDANRTNSPARKKSVRLIGLLNHVAQQVVPGQVTRYEDSFIHGAFDENFTRFGTSLVLIESGGQINDPEKQQVRMLNFLLLVNGLKAIANKSYLRYSSSHYNKLPVSEQIGFDLLLRQATFRQEGREYLLDIGVRRTDMIYDNFRKFRSRFYIAEKGDLTHCFGYQEINANGLMLWQGKTYPKRINNINALLGLQLDSLINVGYTNFSVLQNIPQDISNQYPVNIVKDTIPVAFPLALRSEPNFVLLKNGVVVSVVINGIYRTVR